MNIRNSSWLSGTFPEVPKNLKHLKKAPVENWLFESLKQGVRQEATVNFVSHMPKLLEAASLPFLGKDILVHIQTQII